MLNGVGICLEGRASLATAEILVRPKVVCCASKSDDDCNANEKKTSLLKISSSKAQFLIENDCIVRDGLRSLQSFRNFTALFSTRNI